MGMKFTERMGFVKVNNILQKDDVSPRLKNLLWNKIIEINTELELDNNHFYKRLWGYFLGRDLTKIPYYRTGSINRIDIKEIVKDEYCEEEWYNIYIGAVIDN